MDEFSVTVEDLDFSLRDKSSGKHSFQSQTSGQKSTDSGSATQTLSKDRFYASRLLNLTPFDSQTSKLPSLRPKDRSDSKVINRDKTQDEASRGFQPPHNRLSLEDLNLIQPGLHATALKCGKTLLAPLVDRKQPSKENTRQRSTTNPEHSASILTYKAAQFENLRTHQAIDHSGTDAESIKAQFPNGSVTKLKELCPNNELKKNLLEIPSLKGRRFSAPLSPRFVRRLVPERIYSSSELDIDNVQNSGEELGTRTLDRGSIFSPPANEFDQIQDEEKHKEFEQKKFSKAPRKSLDLNFHVNTTRFLSEIKVSLADKNDTKHFRKSRVKSTDKRKNSYTLSASSESLITGDVLPPVKTSMPECQPPGRSRALSTSGLIPLGRNDIMNKPFDSPMFLDVESERLSHLSLSPRLPRKF